MVLQALPWHLLFIPDLSSSFFCLSSLVYLNLSLWQSHSGNFSSKLMVVGQSDWCRHMRGHLFYTERAVLVTLLKYNNIKKRWRQTEAQGLRLSCIEIGNVWPAGCCLAQRLDSITKQACNGHMLHLIIPLSLALPLSVRRYAAPGQMA